MSPPFSCNIGERNICSDSFFFSLYFCNALQSHNNSNRVFWGINMVWAITLAVHFNPCLAERDKMSLSQKQDIFMPVNN